MNLYRYISLDKFKNMLETSSLCFVNPLTMWEDDKEGPLYKAMRTKEGREGIIRIMRDNHFSENDIQVWSKALKGEIYGLRCQCWSKSSDCIRMWKEYAQDMQGVRIETSAEKIKSLQYMKHTVELMPILYKELSLKDEIESVFDKRNGIFYFPRAFRIKGVEFEFENEIRAYTATNSPKTSERIEVIIPKISDFIISVKVHRQADKVVFDTVRALCEKHCLKFLDASG